MSLTVWKFEFQVDDSIILQMPKGAKVLKIELQGVVPCLWALVNPMLDTERRIFLIYGTGHKIEGMSENRYVDTFQQGSLVWHVFE